MVFMLVFILVFILRQVQLLIFIIMASPAELFSSVKAVEILRNPLNNSSAKNHWTIPKSNRFPKPKVECDAIYELSHTKTNRTTGFGSGKKVDLDYGKHPHNITPSPVAYQPPNFIDLNRSHHKGYTVGIGRQETAPLSYIDLEARKVPGPGRYHTININNTPKWSMRPRTASQLFPSGTKTIVPGPGKYQSTESINSVGKYYTSRHRSSGSKHFNPKSSKRFAKSISDSPGVGSYDPKNELSGLGIYVLSKNPSSGRRAILNGPRNSFIELKHNQTPGPGSYRLPSDFGQYDKFNTLSNSIVMGNMMGNKSTINSKPTRPYTSKGR